jgi:hypothetical protein
MRSKLLSLTLSVLVAAGLALVVAGPVGASGFSRSIAASGSTAMGGTATGPEGLQFPEIMGEESEGDAGDGFDGVITDRSLSGHGHQGASVNSARKAKSNPDLLQSFDGLNHRQQRLANGGNQFSLEPPDQGMCVGNGYVLETVNDVLRVFDTSGNPVTGVVDQNTFYGYIPAINRTTGVRGPFVTDPSCLYDAATQRWFHVVLTLDTLPNGAFTGKNHLDLAVSQTANPAGAWNIYRIPVQDDGTDGTPDHGCPLTNAGTGHGPCLGDYPHIGADANGFYITTNEYAFFPDNIFMSANVYALPKAALASGAPSVTLTQFDTVGADGGNPGFTLWPSQSPATGSYETGAGGSEYFMSSNAAEEANGDGDSTDLLVWALTNTSSLNGAPALSLSHTTLTVGQYGIPPKADQKAGDFPLGQCLNIPSCATFLNGEPDPFAPEVESHIDSNDTRMQQVDFANGKLWGALDTALTLNGVNKAGIEYFVVKPSVAGGVVSAKLALQGYLGLTGNNLTYPAIGVTPSGRGVMAFTVTGADYFPSAGYASIDAQVGAGDIHVASEGLGPADGFTSYKYYVGNPPRTRWGDYGAAAVVGSHIWIASEYIHSACTLAQYLAAPVGSCGGTRSALGNWGTRISELST